MIWFARRAAGLLRSGDVRGRVSVAASTALIMTTGTVETIGELTDDELAILELERSWWKYAAVKESRVRERFEISSTVYYARLNRLIDRPEAMFADPLTVRWLQRLRERAPAAAISVAARIADPRGRDADRARIAACRMCGMKQAR